MGTMRAIVMEGTGGPETLKLAEIAQPIPVNSEFLVKVIAAGVNPIDAKTRAGRGVSAAIASYPAILGNDFSGIVVTAPFESHPIKAGDEVYGVTGVPRVGGAYAEYVAVSSMSIAKRPKALTHVEAAGVPTAALTAWGAVVEVAKAHEGQRMLIHGGAGGVGHFAVQFARFFGAYVIATGSANNLDRLTELGANETIDYAKVRFENVIEKIDVVVDLIGNVHEQTGTRSLGVLRPGGLIVNVPSGSWPTLIEDAADAGVRATRLKTIPDGSTLAVISRLIESGDVRVDIDQVFPLEDAAKAHEAIETGHTHGKIVLTVAEY
jgi:NADPH:quinone reductase-like Zn-dependent oxidoreductase